MRGLPHRHEMREKGSPRDCVGIEIDAAGQFVNFISPFAELNGCLAMLAGQHAGYACSVCAQMRHERVLLMQAGCVAYLMRVALDEDALRANLHDAGGGKGTRAYGEQFHRVVNGAGEMRELAQDSPYFTDGERRPVGRYERAVESVCVGDCAHDCVLLCLALIRRCSVRLSVRLWVRRDG